MEWLTSYFLNPAFVIPGVALISLPIIIHLINRMRYRRVRFAAMEFLLASDQRNRRRVLIEQLLLLLLRILIVLLIVFLIARLLLDPQAASVFRSAKTVHVVLLDDGISMQTKWGNTTAFDQAKETVQALVDEGARQPGKQRLTLMRLSDPENQLFEQRDINDEFVLELKSKLRNLKPTYETPSLSEGLNQVREYINRTPDALIQVHVVSNFRSVDWVREQVLTDQVNEFDEEGITVNLIRSIPERKDNLTLESLTMNLSQLIAGTPLEVTASVTNHSSRTVENVPVEVFADGRPISIRQADVQQETALIPSIEPGATAEVSFETKFLSSGWHRLEARLQDDPLPADNRRFIAVELRPSNRVLVIDGDPDGVDAAYMLDVLDGVSYSVGGVEPVPRGVEALRKEVLSQYSSVYLMNIAALPDDAIRPLSRYVEEGGGLVWFVGPSVDPDAYNRDLYDGANRLFPVPLESSPETLLEKDVPDIQFLEHPMFTRFFNERGNPFIEQIQIRQYLRVARSRKVAGETFEWLDNDDDRKDSVTTMARLRSGDPLIFDGNYGQGRVIAFLTTAGPVWNDWATHPAPYVSLHINLQRYVSKQNGRSFPKVVGDDIETEFDPTTFIETVLIQAPDLKRAIEVQAVEVEREEEPGSEPATTADAQERRSRASYGPGAIPGIYAFALRPVGGGDATSIEYAVNNATSQSDLELATNETLSERFEESSNIRVHEPGETDWLRAQTSDADTRNLLLFVLILLIVAEQALGYRLSYHLNSPGRR